MANRSSIFWQLLDRRTDPDYGKYAPWIMVAGGIVFSLCGLLLFYQQVMPDWIASRQASHWQATPCIIQSSQVIADSGNRNHDQYLPAIEFAYTFDGQTYLSRQYRVTQNIAGSRKKIQRIIDSLPPGLQTLCHVNPSHPEQAVLDRQWSPNFMLILFCLAFIAMGLLFARYGYRSSKWPSAHPSDQPLAGFLPPCDPDARELIMETPQFNREGGIIALPLVLLLTTATLVGSIQNIMDPSDEAPLPLIIVIGLFGLLFLSLTLLLLRRLIRPKVTGHQLILRPGVLRLGQPATLQWTVDRPQNYRRIKIQLIGSEVAVQADEVIRPDQTHRYWDQSLVDATEPAHIGSGQITLTVPEQAMHSMELPNNDIQWEIQLILVRANGKSTMEEYDVVVLPAKWPVKNH